MYVLFDDVRDLNADIIVRNYEAAERVLDSMDLVDYEVGLDHDLGSRKTGYDILMYMLQIGNLPKLVQLVTSNPVGRDKMALALREEGYESTDGINWKMRLK